MEKITLVILAAGMGSRFGGLKQIEPVDPEGHIIIDFSLFDAWRAGFRDVVFIIKREMEAEFRECIGDRMEQYFHVSYVYQDLDRLPEGIEVPEGRTKPWGTGHALACCKGVVNGPFAVINADDFYGRTAFSEIYAFLAAQTDERKYAMGMLGNLQYLQLKMVYLQQKQAYDSAVLSLKQAINDYNWALYGVVTLD